MHRPDLVTALVRDMVEAVAKKYSVAPAAPASVALAVISDAVQLKLWIEAWEGFRSLTNIQVMLVAESSAKKSPVVEEVAAAMYEAHDALAKRDGPAIRKAVQINQRKVEAVEKARRKSAEKPIDASSVEVTRWMA